MPKGRSLSGLFLSVPGLSRFSIRTVPRLPRRLFSVPCRPRSILRPDHRLSLIRIFLHNSGPRLLHIHAGPAASLLHKIAYSPFLQ